MALKIQFHFNYPRILQKQEQNLSKLAVLFVYFHNIKITLRRSPFYVISILYQFLKMDLSKLRPDWNAAALHGLSTVPGISKGDLALKCPCCMNPIEKQPAGLCGNSKQLQFLGFGFPLFYIFLKYCILMLAISVASYNGIVLYWALNNREVLCAQLEKGCSSFMVTYSQIDHTVPDGEVVVRIFSFIIQLAMLAYIRDLITKTRDYYDERTCSLSDYSVLVTNIPSQRGTKARLEAFLAEAFDKPYKAYDITFLPNYEEFFRMEDQKEEIINKMRPLMQDQQNNKDLLQQLQVELVKKEHEVMNYCNQQIRLQESDQCLTEKLIFSCWTEDQKCAILQAFEEMTQQKLREAFHVAPEDDCDIAFGDAPQPKEINWEYINYPDNKRLWRMVAGWIMTFLFMLTITVIFFILLSEKSTLIEHSFQMANDDAQYYQGLVLVYVALVFVILFNKFVMGTVLHRICDFERHPTTDLQGFHFALKYSVGMFFTTALMTLAVEDMRFHNFFQRPYGVIEEETMMFIMNALFVPFIWMINPWQLGVLVKRKLNMGRNDLTQKEANKIMENVQYNMGKRYAEITQIMWFTYLYSSLIPLGAFLSLLGLCLYYWIDKYNLLRRSSVNSQIAGQLSIFSMKLLDFTLLCKPIGELIFDSQIRDSYCVSSIIMSALAVLYLVLPINEFLRYFHPQKFKTQERNYQEAQRFFKDTYQTLHPIFSLKQSNRNKMYKSFRPSCSQKPSICIRPEEISPNALNNPIQIESISETSSNAINPLKDATNILKALFKKHNVFSPSLPPPKLPKEKENIEEWS